MPGICGPSSKCSPSENISSWSSMSGRKTSSVVPSRSRNVRIVASWFSRQRREWMKKSTIDVEDPINSSNRWMKRLKDPTRTMPDAGSGAELIGTRSVTSSARRRSAVRSGERDVVEAEVDAELGPVVNDVVEHHAPHHGGVRHAHHLLPAALEGPHHHEVGVGGAGER